ncbi:MAG TPA: HisA/HisF-related TIM barrel protein [Petrotogaceae bacterium]|nr:HisA/HisF-related TIM barrel protein [Petrotogaceae bacterium]
MIFIPAIDLLNNQAVRLEKGNIRRVSYYGEPLEIAAKLSKKFKLLHIIDLNGSFEGEPKNMKIVEKIIHQTGVQVQLGGGLRSHRLIEKAFRIGVTSVILGTKAFDSKFIDDVTKDFKNITVSLDIKNGKILLNGWTERKDLSLAQAYSFLTPRIKRFVVTMTQNDGTLKGIKKIKKFWKEDEQVMYAGGIKEFNDLKKLQETGFYGAVCGKAVYENLITPELLAEEMYAL